MVSHDSLTEIVSFNEFTSVNVAEVCNPMYDIEKPTQEDCAKYCQNLFNKIFRLEYSKIPEFIDHHCKIANDSTQWLNNLEKLVLANSSIFQNNRNGVRLIKIQACIEVKRYKMNLENPCDFKSKSRHDKKAINAESGIRYFSFDEVKEKLIELSTFEEKMAFLTNEKCDKQGLQLFF